MRWTTTTDTRPIPTQPRRLTACEVRLIESRQADFHALTGQPRAVAQAKPLPELQAFGRATEPRNQGDPGELDWWANLIVGALCGLALVLLALAACGAMVGF